MNEPVVTTLIDLAWSYFLICNATCVGFDILVKKTYQQVVHCFNCLFDFFRQVIMNKNSSSN